MNSNLRPAKAAYRPRGRFISNPKLKRQEPLAEVGWLQHWSARTRGEFFGVGRSWARSPPLSPGARLVSQTRRSRWSETTDEPAREDARPTDARWRRGCVFSETEIPTAVKNLLSPNRTPSGNHPPP